jgi:restriction system protein
MNKSFKVMAGLGGKKAKEFMENSFIGINFDVNIDLAQFEGTSFETFKQDINFKYWSTVPHNRNKGSIAMTNRQLWQFAFEMNPGDIVISQDGLSIDGAITYAIGKITGEYIYSDDLDFPHQRKVEWGTGRLSRHSISAELNNYFKSGTTIVDLSLFTSEIELIASGNLGSSALGNPSSTLPNLASSAHDSPLAERTGFVLESHLEEYMVRNWNSIEFGKNYDIYMVDGEVVGQQYQVDTGNIDILALSKDGNQFLVVELKRGRASDVVVGQIQRYMGFVKEELAEPHQTVAGAIIALEDDLRIRRALSVTQNISFYQYSIKFSLDRVDKNNL